MFSSKTFYLAFVSILLFILYQMIIILHGLKTENLELASDNETLKERLVWDKELKDKLYEMKIQWDGVGGYVESAKDEIDRGELSGIEDKLESMPREYLETIYKDRIIKHGLANYFWAYKDFGYPVYSPEKSYVSSEFYNARKFNGAVVFHQALDIVATTDHRILATLDGVVRARGYNKILGNYIEIRHFINNEYYLTEYAHAEIIYPKKGARVKKGDVIGVIGLSGNTTGYHLHFALKKWNGRINDYYPVNIVATSTWGLKIKD
jgi:murein DD-endopeptidase MepM/ murein hydrolase activator NlpD